MARTAAHDSPKLLSPAFPPHSFPPRRPVSTQRSCFRDPRRAYSWPAPLMVKSLTFSHVIAMFCAGRARCFPLLLIFDAAPLTVLQPFSYRADCYRIRAANAWCVHSVQ